MANYEVVTQNETTSSSGIYETFTVSAPSGKFPVSGGIRNLSGTGSGSPTLKESYPDGCDWKFVVFGGTSAFDIRLYVVCQSVYSIEVEECP